MKPASLVHLATILSLGLVRNAQALLQATETSTHLVLKNDRLYAAVRKSNGAVSNLTLDSVDLLGPATGSVGIGPYLGKCIFFRPSMFRADKLTTLYEQIVIALLQVRWSARATL